MEILFYCTAALSIICIGLALTARQAVHALLFLVSAVLSLSVNLYVLGNELFGVLLVIIYAGAIVVLFIFVVMLLNPVPTNVKLASVTQAIREFFVPLLISSVVLLVFIFAYLQKGEIAQESQAVAGADVVFAFFNDGWFFVELLSLLLTASFVGAFHIAKRQRV